MYVLLLTMLACIGPEDPNSPPMVLAPNDDNTVTRVAVVGSPTVISLDAVDRDGDDLWVDWSAGDVQPLTVQTLDDATVWTSTALLERTDVTDGQLIEAVVSDGVNDVSVVWRLDRPE